VTNHAASSRYKPHNDTDSGFSNLPKTFSDKTIPRYLLSNFICNVNLSIAHGVYLSTTCRVPPIH